MNSLLRYFYSTPSWLARRVRQKKGRKLVLYGAGEIGIDLFVRLGEQAVICWVDRSFEKWPNGLLGKPVVDLQSLEQIEFDFVVICSDLYSREIYQLCRDRGIPEAAILVS